MGCVLSVPQSNRYVPGHILLHKDEDNVVAVAVQHTMEQDAPSASASQGTLDGSDTLSIVPTTQTATFNEWNTLEESMTPPAPNDVPLTGSESPTPLVHAQLWRGCGHGLLVV